MSQQLEFTKMHGLGNDFVLIDAINQNVSLDKSWIRHMSERHTGIGFDQLILVEKSHTADFSCRFFNADGTEAEQCGNGIRCVARFVLEENFTTLKSFSIETKAGMIPIVIHDFDKIEAQMGIPIFLPEKIPFLAEQIKKIYAIENFSFSALSMGNPHAIFRTDHLENCPLEETAQLLTQKGVFPQGVNIGFIEILNRENIRLRTLERGVGETFACGSNACAAVVAGILNDWLKNKVTVHFQLNL